MKNLIHTAVVTLFAASAAHAQQAVQWRVSDGGNGHWYVRSTSVKRWVDANSHCESIGGHMVTLTTAAERAFVWNSLALAGADCWLGGFQQAGACEPGCGWAWVTGEPWDYTNWWSVAPDNNQVLGNEDRLDANGIGLWDDAADCAQCTNRYVIEFERDCNDDGIVDYGQIALDQLADADSNGVPDCCEQGTGCDTATMGLEAYLKFHGDCLDSSGNGRDGAATAIAYSNGPSSRTGLAATFDGLITDVRIQGIPIPTNNQFSWALWFRTETIGNIALLQRIESIGNNLMSPSLFIRTNGSLGFGSYSFASGGTSIETGPGVVAPGTWIHVACTSATSGLRRLYVNGQLIGENYSADYGQPLAMLLLGRDRVDCCDRFRGMMDELRIYSRALAPAEVLDLSQPAPPADCDHNGIPDYRQCLDGTLADYNGNTIPDCCELGTPCTPGRYPVQWRVIDGGNGHWYGMHAINQADMTWMQMREAATRLGGHLITLSSAEEDAFGFRFFAGLHEEMMAGPLGYFVMPGGQWESVTGEPISYSNWRPAMTQPPLAAAPDNGNTLHRFATWLDPSWGPVAGSWEDWQDSELGNPADPISRFLIEWDADCNNDGVVDYGQILLGQIVDTNTNGIPDICEGPTCNDIDLNLNGIVDGGDLGVLLAFWGPVSPAFPRADINRDGVVNGADLGIVLAFWGPCPN